MNTPGVYMSFCTRNVKIPHAEMRKIVFSSLHNEFIAKLIYQLSGSARCHVTCMTFVAVPSAWPVQSEMDDRLSENASKSECVNACMSD